MTEKPSHWPLRILAIVIAGALWLTTSFVPRIQELRVERVTQQFEATVSYRTPEGFMILNPEQRVTVTVRGRDQDVYGLSDENVNVAIPFPANVTPGSIEAPVGADNVTLPQGLDVLSIVPNTLSLIIDRRITNRVPVRVVFRGEPIVGFAADRENPVVIPTHVEIAGPEKEVQTVPEVVALVDITARGAVPEFETQIAPTTNNEYVRVVQPNLVTVQVKMVPLNGPSNAPGFLP